MDQQVLRDLIDQLRLRGQEWATVDAKSQLILRETGDKAEFVKDVAAMANNACPSYLVIGLVDGTFADVGKLTEHHTKNDINQVLADKIDPPVVADYEEFIVGENEYAVVEIVGRNAPYIVARDVVHNKTDRKQVRVLKGTIFVRHEDRTEGIGRAELEELLKKRWLYEEFRMETARAQKLVRDRPKYWEHLLTAELMKSKLEQVSRSFQDLRRGLSFTPTQSMRGKDYFDWLQSRFKDLSYLVVGLRVALKEEIPASWGPAGVDGDPLETKQAVDKLIALCNELVQLEASLRSVSPPQPFLRARSLVEGWAEEMYARVESFPDRLLAVFQQPNPKGHYQIDVNFDAPSTIGEFQAEILRLQQHAQEWANLY